MLKCDGIDLRLNQESRLSYLYLIHSKRELESREKKQLATTY